MSVPSNIESSRSLLREVACCEDEIKSPIDDYEEFPTTCIRVLLVDADPNSSLLFNSLITNQVSYQVTFYEKGEDAMSFLMKGKHEIDLVIWDFDVPNIDGVEALKTIGKQMNLPVVIMSRDPKKETVMKSTTYGACDFLVKPVSKEVIAVLWRHVFCRKSKSCLSDWVESEAVEYDTDLYQSEEGSKTAEYSGEQNTWDANGGKSKKPRMTWTRQLHENFEAAVDKIGGIDKAYPKQILKYMQEEMNVQGLTRNNVASHLQKYRLGANKKNLVPQETQEDLGWHNARPTAASKPLVNAGINLPCFRNDQAAVANLPIQYPSSTYQTLNNNNNPFMTANPLANLPPYVDQIYQPQQQQQQFYAPVQTPSVRGKAEPGLVSARENWDPLIYDPALTYDPDFYHPAYNNFGQFNSQY